MEMRFQEEALKRGQVENSLHNFYGEFLQSSSRTLQNIHELQAAYGMQGISGEESPSSQPEQPPLCSMPQHTPSLDQ